MTGALSVITGNLYCFCWVHIFPSAFFQTTVFWEGDQLVCEQLGEKRNRGWRHWLEGDRLHLVRKGPCSLPGGWGGAQHKCCELLVNLGSLLPALLRLRPSSSGAMATSHKHPLPGFKS